MSLSRLTCETWLIFEIFRHLLPTFCSLPFKSRQCSKLKQKNGFTECILFTWAFNDICPLQIYSLLNCPPSLDRFSRQTGFWNALRWATKLSSDTNGKMTCENRRPKRNRLTVRNSLAADWGLIATVTKLVSSFTRWSHANLMTQNWSSDWKQFTNVAAPCVQLKLIHSKRRQHSSKAFAQPHLHWLGESPVECSYAPHVPVLQCGFNQGKERGTLMKYNMHVSPRAPTIKQERKKGPAKLTTGLKN